MAATRSTKEPPPDFTGVWREPDDDGWSFYLQGRHDRALRRWRSSTTFAASSSQS